MRESDLLAHIYARSAALSAAFPWVEVGPGHDCAVIRADGRLLLKIDQLVEHRHFTPGTPPGVIARKALARPLSDIAAMAGRPLAALASATLPHGYPQHQADALFDAMHNQATAFACPVVGGDIASHAAVAPMVLSVTIIGAPHPLRGPVLRSGAQPGDELFVTGGLGGSLEAATGGGKHLTFTPRINEATWLADTLGPHLHAMMDISDGLGIDAGRMALASGVCVRLLREHIPLSPGITDPNRALRDGEDYELLFAAAPGILPSTGVTPTGCVWTRIGRTEQGAGAWLSHAGAWTDVSHTGWDHT